MNSNLFPALSNLCYKVLPLVYDDALSYYEIMGKLVAKINELVNADNSFMAELNKLHEELAEFDNDLVEAVNKVLTKWLNDGTLNQIVNSFANLGGWTPSGNDHEDFKKDSVRCAVSHMVHALGCKSVVPGSTGLQNLTVPFVARYSNRLTWEAANDTTPDEEREFRARTRVTYQGRENVPVAYLDCSSWLILLDCCRFYGPSEPSLHNESPYYYAFINNLAGGSKDVVARCCEAGTWIIKPYTFDYLNNVGTGRMAYMMNTSGNRCVLIGDRSDIAFEPNINEDVIAQMETGDQIFYGGDGQDNHYRGIGHCGLYIKTLDELNEFGKHYNATFQPLAPGMHPEYGYVVHVTGADDPVDLYSNVIRLNTLYDTMNLLKYKTWWVAKPYSNALISNKANVSFHGLYRANDANLMFNRVFDGDVIRDGYMVRDDGYAFFANMDPSGERELTSGDANICENGVVYRVVHENFSTTANLPPQITKYSVSASLLKVGARPGAWGVQFCWAAAINDPYVRLCVRFRNLSGAWSAWRELSFAQPVETVAD